MSLSVFLCLADINSQVSSDNEVRAVDLCSEILWVLLKVLMCPADCGTAP